MKAIFILVIVLCRFCAQAQKVDSIYINLYTDSLKKGTYNYINVDGLLSNGKYVPLDSTVIKFSASEGKFFGNSLWIDEDTEQEKICIEVMLKSNSLLRKKFIIYIKKKPDDEQLKTIDEIIK